MSQVGTNLLGRTQVADLTEAYIGPAVHYISVKLAKSEPMTDHQISTESDEF